MNSRRLLAFDTAGASCSAALWAEGALRAWRFEARERGHGERLLPMVEEVLREAGLDYFALDALAVTRGPGTFTGVRIGLSAARGLALAAGKPLIGVDRFTLTAFLVPEEARRGRTLVLALESKRAELFMEVRSDDGELLLPGRPVMPEAAAALLPPGPLLLAGDAAERLRDRLAGRELTVLPGSGTAAELARLAAALPLPAVDAPPPEPLYLRPADVTLPNPAAP